MCDGPKRPFCGQRTIKKINKISFENQFCVFNTKKKRVEIKGDAKNERKVKRKKSSSYYDFTIDFHTVSSHSHRLAITTTTTILPATTTTTAVRRNENLESTYKNVEIIVSGKSPRSIETIKHPYCRRIAGFNRIFGNKSGCATNAKRHGKRRRIRKIIIFPISNIQKLVVLKNIDVCGSHL